MSTFTEHDQALLTILDAIDEYEATHLAAAPIPQTGKYVAQNPHTQLWEYFYDGQHLGACAFEQEAYDVLNAYLYDQERTGALYQPRPTATAAGTRIEPCICDDAISVKHYGKSWGTRYLVGEDDAQAEIFVPHKIEGLNTVQVFMLGTDGFDVADVEAVLPNLIALLEDLSVRRAIAEAEARAA